ncbi:MAG TPA: AAA family ATPase, partial [Acidimicrobiales bacterium]|nr:AAA family ATPase [Acidimicrobiales bacterium]
MTARGPTATAAPGRAAGALPDPLDAGLVLGVDGGSLLGAFNRAGVLAPADVHVALRLGRLGGDADELVALAAALAVRAPRVGHVHVDLATVRSTAASDAEDDVDFESLPWPDVGEWVERVAASPLVAVGPDGPDDRPLRLAGTALYLDRYWRDEGSVAVDLLARAGAAGPAVDEGVLAAGLGRLFADDVSGEQGRAAATAVRRRLAVIAGGPGTGKTTTVARLLALLEEQAA